MAKIIKGKHLIVGGGSGGLLSNKMLFGYSGLSTATDLGPFRGIVANGTVSGIAKVGTNSISFNNQKSALDFRFNEVFTQSKEISIGCWLRYNSFNFGGPWGSWENSGITTGQILLYNDSGTSPSRLAFWAAQGSNLYQVLAPNGLIQLNTWHHVLCEFSSPSGFIRMFVDNNLVGSTAIPIGSVLNAGFDTFHLGGFQLNSANHNYNGNIEQFFVTYGNLSQSERDTIWNNGNGQII